MATADFVIHPAPPVAPPEVIEQLKATVTPHLSDNLARLSGIFGLRPMHGKSKLVGTAFTIKTRPGDNLIIYKALTMLSPGHVLVVDGGGHETNALVGELIMLYAIERGCAGFVLDGAIRDVAAFREKDFPCYACAISHRGPYKNGPGQINVPVSVCGQVVHPGDLIVGDEDGLVNIPQEEIADVLLAARRSASMEENVRTEIATGAIEQSWMERTMKPYGL